jgi:phosphoserine aminotransferase
LRPCGNPGRSADASDDDQENVMSEPRTRPGNPRFGSGPTAKRPGWSLAALEGALVGRSHRAKAPKARLAELLDRSHALLGLPEGYRIGLVPGSDTGAFEMAMWNLLGARGVDVLAFESFGYGWQTDIENELEIEDRRIRRAGYGELPPLEHDPARDLVFTWNGTTSGVRVPNGDWIATGREGLTLCDATSAAFAMALPWDKLDAATYSWQKVLGGEAQHGMLILSPRAVERLESYRPPWPLPKLLRLTARGKLIEGIFRGETINTPSMLAVEDALDGLAWAERLGGLEALIARSAANLELVAAWVARTPWVDFLPRRPEMRSSTSICLKIVDPLVQALPPASQAEFVKGLVGRLEQAGVAYDIGAYRDAPPGLRLWGGATVEASDLAALLPWLEFAFQEQRRAEAF